MKKDYKQPLIWFNEFITEDVITASVTSGSVSVPTGVTNPLTDIVTPDPFGDDD